MVDKLPPHSVDAEESVLGSLLIDGETIHKIDLTKEDFYNEACSSIYRACLRVDKINQITVAYELERMGVLELVGGAAFLSHLVAVTPTAWDIEEYAKVVKESSLSRQIIVCGNQISDIGVNTDNDTSKGIEKAQRLLTELSKKSTDVNIVTPSQAGDSMLSNMDGIKAHKLANSWGFADLDRITTGLYRQDYTVIGARPSVGKSQIMFEITDHLISQGLTGLFVSLEMGLRAIQERQIARNCGISVRELRGGELGIDKWGEIATLAGEISTQDMYYLVQDCTASEIASISRNLKDKHGLDFVMLDYIQLLKDCRGVERMHTAISGASKIMKSLAKELDINVIVASQLNRGVEMRSAENRRPQLSDLKESGSLEEDADIAFLLYRPELYDYNTPDQGVLEVKMAKNRQLGQAPAVKLQWLARESHYVDRANWS